MKKITLLFSAFAIATILITGCSSSKKTSTTSTTTTTTTTSETKPKKIEEKMVLIKTTMGDIKIKLYNETPLHRDAFIANVTSGFYNDLLFHRVIKGFMIQGGDPMSRNAKPGQMLGMGSKNTPPQRIPAEFNPSLFHKKGALCAARDNNPQKASSDCQFYIVQGKTMTDAEIDATQKQNGMTYTPEQREILKTIGGTPFLDNNYTVYGEVIEGLDVIDKIAATTTAVGDRPVTDVKFTMTVIE